MAFSTLTDGTKIPSLGFGTFLSKPGEVAQAVKVALETGYRHFDFASAYQNQKEIGVALKEVFAQGKIKREDLWLTSKLFNNDHHAEVVLPSLQQTLTDLQVSFLDLYLIHWPICDVSDPNPVPVIETWRELEKAKEAGLVKHIGVSNFNVQILNDLYSASKIKPEVNQVELHPYLQQTRLIDFCRKKGIHVTAWSPLMRVGTGQELDPLKDVVLQKIAAKHKKTITQILVRWGFQRDPNVSVIPKSVTPARIRENFNVFDFQLDKQDLEDIAKLDRHQRLSDISKIFGIPVFD
ncbi:MAG: aldehyde reductase [Streblomastix strix]|uniref:Aldehyde reductase n=1 Tax=Streblomastix strix TaxID=222440 RepID=A0A5J4XBZ5_9EUKA|nr:MAG: aldehyde reductase [Streblomastix strix]